MNNAAAGTEGMSALMAAEKLSAAKRGLVLSVLIPVATLGVSAWVYLEGAPSLHEHAALLQQMDRWLLRLAMVAALGGSAFLVTLLTGLVKWHRLRIVRLLE